MWRDKKTAKVFQRTRFDPDATLPDQVRFEKDFSVSVMDTVRDGHFVHTLCGIKEIVGGEWILIAKDGECRVENDESLLRDYDYFSPLREFPKQPGTRITAILFALWFLFNQGKMTSLGIFGGKPGQMFTCATVIDIAAGLFVHGVILCICAGVGFGISIIADWILRRFKA